LRIKITCEITAKRHNGVASTRFPKSRFAPSSWLFKITQSLTQFFTLSLITITPLYTTREKRPRDPAVITQNQQLPGKNDSLSSASKNGKNEERGLSPYRSRAERMKLLGS